MDGRRNVTSVKVKAEPCQAQMTDEDLIWTFNKQNQKCEPRAALL